ncbi:MAG: cytidylate kinase [SAR202 cluster bacterium Io17-Chloro-G9]|nr:MAG: cytidylate kinase [SAR202 cluster bacterium Io17-Chloro-G9]
MAHGVSTIAIDGPVAAGKTVVGRELAGRLGFSFLDTGVMYRAITWLALANGTSIDDPDSLRELAEANPVELVSKDSSRVRVGGNEVGQELRSPAVEANVSTVSTVSPVRKAMVAQQRDLAAKGEIVMTGRDIGTVVLPDADLKVYLLASPENRAHRRWKEIEDRDDGTSYEQVLMETKRRDSIDSGRVDSPLRPASDAWTLDTEYLSVPEVVDRIIEAVKQLR